MQQQSFSGFPGVDRPVTAEEIMNPPWFGPTELWDGTPIGPKPKHNRRKWSRERLVEEAQKAAAEKGGAISVHDFLRHIGGSSPTIYSYFPGGWAELREAAGLEPVRAGVKPRWTDAGLLAEYERAFEQLGRHPSWDELDRLAEPSRSTFKNRFGGKRALEERFEEWQAR